MRHIFITFFVVITLSSCVDKVICPAFQSTYILDDSSRTAFYSPLWKLEKDERLRYLASLDTTSSPIVSDLIAPDSLGPVVASVGKGNDYFAHVEPYVLETREVKKSKFGIIKKQPHFVKNFRLKTAPMENLLAPKPEEVPPPVEDYGEFVASDFSDSLGIDSTAMAMQSDTFEIPTLALVEPPKPKNELKYLYGYDPNDKMLNVEQVYYNKHFGNQLYAYIPIKQKPDPEAAGVTDEEIEAEGGFFKNLFKRGRQKKNLIDEDDLVEDEALPTIPEEEEEPVEEVVEEEVDDGF